MQTYTLSQFTSPGGGMETGGGEKRSGEERRATGNVGEKIFELTVREKTENKIRNESHGLRV